MPPHLLLGHLRTGEIVAELDAPADFTDQLSAAGSARATISLDAVPVDVDLLAVTAPWRHFMAVSEQDTVLWAGPLVPRTRPPAAGEITLSAAGLWAVFDHRVLARYGSWGFTDPRADLVLTFRSLPGVALDIVRTALDRPHGELPLVLPNLNSSGDETRSYYGYELATAGERLTQLTQAETGPDLHFMPRFTADRSRIEWVLRVGTPVLSQRGVDFHFDDGRQLVAYGWDEDGSVMADTVLVPGDGVERGRLIGRASNDALPRAGWPALDTVITSHSSERQPDVLDAHARAYLDVVRTGITRDSAIVRTDTTPTLGSYLVGDHVVLTPRADRATPAGQRRRRITSITYRASTPTTAELGLAPVPATT
ncbi:hypothetical protein [Actinokineospora cianjurensis]|uniref:ReqiPepy6 Gp37-like protein n=1 Tax=Actinokineospora cianjurensis TaxID=585224 RepID=A0A421AY78_9PSEU|nr:hypothetical protein [Actinokineospora cianjurensis]RLK54817.1 hypothetical protein CLV68_5205 [Actinokineospora cianjurensis]